jgi:hypothetical protein
VHQTGKIGRPLGPRSRQTEPQHGPNRHHPKQRCELVHRAGYKPTAKPCPHRIKTGEGRGRGRDPKPIGRKPPMIIHLPRPGPQNRRRDPPFTAIFAADKKPQLVARQTLTNNHWQIIRRRGETSQAKWKAKSPDALWGHCLPGKDRFRTEFSLDKIRNPA